MRSQLRKVISLLLVFAMLIGLLPVNMLKAKAEAVTPVTENGLTIFSYKGDVKTKRVALAGTMNSWNTDSILLEKGENNIFTTRQKLLPGSYQYKFVIDGKWMDGENLTYVVQGLKIKAQDNVEVGSSLILSAVNVDGEANETGVNPTYSLKEAVSGVSIEGNKLVVSREAVAGKVVVVADYNGSRAEKEITIQSQMYEYIINYKRNDGKHMSWDMWIFGDGLDGSAYKFISEVNGYAQARIKLALKEISVITRPGDWTTQDATKKVGVKNGNSVEVWLVAGDENVYYENPDNQETPKARQIQVNYKRPEADYEGWNLWIWSSGLSDGRQDFKNGVANFPISKDATNVGFIVRKSIPGNDWAEREPNNQQIDRTIVTDPKALEKTTKVFINRGETDFHTVPYLKGPEVKDGKIDFYYRDIDLYEADRMGSIQGVKINIEKKNLKTDEKVNLGSFDMEYIELDQRYRYSLENPERGFDYIYTFDVTRDGNVTRKNDVSNEIEGKSYVRLADTKIGVKASLNMPQVKAGDSFVVRLSLDNPENHELKEAYVDAGDLGQGKISMPLDLLTQNVAVDIGAELGDKTLSVVVVDKYDVKHSDTVRVKVVASEDSDKKIVWDEEIIYFLLTDRFFDGDKSNNDPTSNGSYDLDSIDAYHGGDFQGIIDKVDYLKKLGVTTVWITPIVDNIENNLSNNGGKSYGYHGYWAEDFTRVENRLGNVETLKKLIDVLHDNGMKLMIDVVLNHPGYDTKNNSNFAGMTRAASGLNDVTMELSGLPDFKTEDPEVSKKLVEWQTDWLSKLRTDKGNSVDYFRVDTVKHVEHDTWKEFKNALVEKNPSFKLIGEYYGGSVDSNGGYLANGMMDSILDFEFKNLADRFIKGDIAGVEARLAQRNAKISYNYGLGSFLSSHDEDGFMATKINGNENLQKVAASLQMTAKGNPVIYYGEEIGQSAPYAGNQNRRDFDWTKIENNSLLSHYQKITNLRREHASIFARGDRKSLYADGSVSAFTRSYKGETIFVGLNVSDSERKVTIDLDKNLGNKLLDKFNENREFTAKGGKVQIIIPASSKGGTGVFVPQTDPNLGEDEERKVIFHFDDPDNGNWALWVWNKEPEGNGAEYKFTANDDFGKLAQIGIADDVKKIGFLVKGPNWEKDIEFDRFVDIDENPKHIWIRAKDETVYLNKPIKLEDEEMAIKTFTIDKFREATVKTNKDVDLQLMKNSYELLLDDQNINDKVLSIEAKQGNIGASKEFVIKFKEDLPLERTLKLSFKQNVDGKEITLRGSASVGSVVATDEFDQKYAYDGRLGNMIVDGDTVFKVWAPTSMGVDLVLFENGQVKQIIPMTAEEKGVYSHKISGDLTGKEYMYDVHFVDKTNRTVDPYARAVSVNGERSVVATPKPSSVENPKGSDMKNPIIYELHVRDYSIAENSGMKNKGNFLALTEKGSKADNGQITGLDYLKSLGVTHIQLLPIYDYSKNSVDELNDSEKFNWGYDPVNYNAIEGSYSSDPTNPFNRIEELQNTIDTLHQNGLGVIMDVVYNHVASAAEHAFTQIVPGYYFRIDENGKYRNGTGVGNEIASERAMVRNYIVDSTKFWAETYKLDGFRFDLMGILDVETMNRVYEEAVKINPNFYILGEGWSMGYHPKGDGADQRNANRTPNLAFFSDSIRDKIRGNNDPGIGYVNGASGLEKSLIHLIQAYGEDTKTYTHPKQVIQYVEAHDNYTVWDQLSKTLPNESPENLMKRLKIATAMPLLSFGTPFIHAGQEWARTKGGDHNSYKSPDEVNRFDWDRVLANNQNVEYVRQLIKIRKNYGHIFNIDDYKKVYDIFETKYDGLGGVAFKLENADEDIYVGHNIGSDSIDLTVENGKYLVLVKDQAAKASGLEIVEVKDGKIQIGPLSSLVIVATKLEKLPEEAEEPQDPGQDPAENPKKALIKFDLAGGRLKGQEGQLILNYTVGDIIKMPEAPTKEGYKFTYWKGSKYYPGDSYTIVGDHTFVAQWEKLDGKTDNITEAQDKEKPDGGKVDDIKPNDTKPNDIKPKDDKNPITGDLGIGLYAVTATIAIAAAAYISKKKEYLNK
ncbi:type I pullulanase [Peptoniphilaceae bacterium SGI.131]